MTILSMISVLIALLIATAFGWYVGRQTEWTPWIARWLQGELDAIDALIEAGHYAEAAERASQELKAAERSHGMHDPQVARALMKLAEIEMASGGLGQAKKRLDRALEIRKNHFGEDDHRTVTTRIKIGEWHARQEQTGQAEKIFNEVRDSLQRLLPLRRDDPGLAAIHNHLATLQLAEKRYPEAEANASRAIELARHKDGDAADLVRGLTNLATVQERQKALPAACDTYQSALDECIKAYGNKSPRAATCHQNLASILEQCRKYPSAIGHAKQALYIINVQLGPKTWEYAQSLALLGQLLCALGQYDEGLAQVDEAIKVAERARSSSHPLVIKLKALRKELVDQKFALSRGQGVKETRDVVLSLLRLAPAAISGLLDESPPERLNRRLTPDLPTATEYVRRLVQLQHRAESRLTRMLSAPGTAIDDDQAAADGPVDDVVAKGDLQACMRDYRDRRKSLIARLEQLSSEQWLTIGIQDGRTRATVLILFRQLALQDLAVALQIEECLLTSLNPGSL